MDRRVRHMAALILAMIIILPCRTYAAEGETSAYDTFVQARASTHRDGPFRLRGSETTVSTETANDITHKSTRYYHISGYDINASETFLQFDSRVMEAKTGALIGGMGSTRTSFLLVPEKIYTMTSQPATEWQEQDFTALLPKFVALGTLDQFFMLELLNSDRLPMYEKYLSHGTDTTVNGVSCRKVKADISRTQFAELAGELTKDIKALLGPAADSMTDAQLTFMQTFARGMLTNLDAEIHYVFYIEKEKDSHIVQIDAQMDMANPYGTRTPGTTSRIQSTTSVTLYNFGKEITRVVPQKTPANP